MYRIYFADLTEDPFKSARVPDIDHPVMTCHSGSSQECGRISSTDSGEHTLRSQTPSPLTSTGPSVENARLPSADAPTMPHVAAAGGGGVNPTAYTRGCDAVTQTEPSRAVLCREASSECDIWIKEMLHLPAVLHSVGVQAPVHRTAVDTAIQTESADGGSGDEETVLVHTLSPSKDLNTKDLCVDCGTMTWNTDWMTSDGVVKSNSESQCKRRVPQCAVDSSGSAQVSSETEHPSDPETSSVAVQTSLDEPVLANLRHKVSHLQQKFEEATNALIWQSLKLKLLEMG